LKCCMQTSRKIAKRLSGDYRRSSSASLSWKRDHHPA